MVRGLGWAVLAAVVVITGSVPAGYYALRGSLAVLDGRRTVRGLQAEVRIERDANGVPTIRAGTREDAARALGFLHAQERFFQMDLLRRQAAGELAELFGPALVPMDTEMRMHRFRHRAAGLLARMDAGELRVMDAYAAGVNAGLAELSVRPWEYLVLRARPRPWTREDSLFVEESMTASLQEHDGLDERTRQAIREVYGEEVAAFLRPTLTGDSAALDGSDAALPPVPDAWKVKGENAEGKSQQREQRTAGRELPSSGGIAELIAGKSGLGSGWSPERDEVVGSNSFALAGSRVAGGGALVGNDMHLELGVPNTWYRAALVLPGRTVTGVTLPGVPGMIVGSNGDVAWGFTDAYADTSDVVVVERDPANPARYRVPDGDGWEAFDVARETVRVAGRAPQNVEVVSTRWGPLLTPFAARKGPTLALHWAAYEPDSFNLHLLDMAGVRTVEEAIEVAHRCGLPAQNFVVGDRAGSIAWTLIGRVPRRVGFDGSLPQSWADGARHWDGLLPPELVPTIRNPREGQIWTANNRVVGGEALALLGDGGYDLPARAAQIRDRLTALNGRAAGPKDGLAVQLDDESRFLARWRGLLEGVLTDEAVAGDEGLAELREAVRAWHGHAAIDEAGHRLVRDFRQNVVEIVMNPIYEPVRRHAPELHLSHTRFKGAEEPLWAILTARPAALLPSAETSWDGLLRHAARVTAKMGMHQPGGRALADCTWGEANTLHMQHPFSQILPSRLAKFFDMPAQPLPGDNQMPRVQGVNFGASERMDVSPGREQEGVFHQPGGASGHPLSPFYRAGHADWAAGRAAPFLPGAAKYELVLQP